jgi:hypothetical protein
LAACEAFGLHYWGEHPLEGHVWAVDDRQHAHVVRMGRAAAHVCQTSSEAEQCPGFIELEEADRTDYHLTS